MKKIISLVVRKVPRKYLQLFSHIALKFVAIFYRGDAVECPVCESQFSKFAPYGRIARENALCPNCLALERHRLMWLFLKDKTSFFTPGQEVLHIAPEICFIDRFEKIHGDNYITADLESPLAKVKMDIHEMPFDDNRFEVAFCNHVMEHVADDIQSMKEIHRVLKPGGWAIIQIPFFEPVAETTFEDDSITDPAEREKIFGQDDHVRLYGNDYATRLRSAGFEVDENDFINTLSSEVQAKYALPKDEIIFLCKKA